jgi:hypothetical protein
MRRGCSTGVCRRDVSTADAASLTGLKRSRSWEEQNVALALVIAFLVIQLTNTTPILEMSVKSVIPGIRGTAEECGFVPVS